MKRLLHDPTLSGWATLEAVVEDPNPSAPRLCEHAVRGRACPYGERCKPRGGSSHFAHSAPPVNSRGALFQRIPVCRMPSSELRGPDYVSFEPAGVHLKGIDGHHGTRHAS